MHKKGNRSGEADFLFENDFELYIKKQLEDRGYSVFHSVYLEVDDEITQVDLVAVKGYQVLSFECKSHYGSDWELHTRTNWKYTDTNNVRHEIHNPCSQNAFHNKAICQLCESLDSDMRKKYNVPIAHYKSVIVCKAPIRSEDMNIFNVVNYTKLDDFLDQYQYSKGEEIDNYFHSLILPILERCSDSSDIALLNHIKYLKGKGLWKDLI